MSNLEEEKQIVRIIKSCVDLNQAASLFHTLNHKWWYKKDSDVKLERNKGEMLMLMVSEIAEAMEGERKNLMDDHLPHRKMVEVELADLYIRLLDYVGAYGYDLDGAVYEKMLYNLTRKDHSYEEREKPNGKKF
jgi:hypothetical protein